MSMTSAQIDELRKSEQEWNQSNMFELARMCREAADTIWQLRDDLQRANAAVQDAEHDESMAWDRVRKADAENAKLKQELEAVGTASYLYGRSDLKAENAKLRELCADLFKGFDCGWPSDVCGDCKRDGMGMPVGGCKLENCARELGIEVTE